MGSVLVVEGVPYMHTLGTDGAVLQNETHECRSNQEESDTQLVVYLHYAKNQGYTNVMVRLSYSDVFFIILYHVLKLKPLNVFLDSGTGKDRHVYNMTQIADDIGLHSVKLYWEYM